MATLSLSAVSAVMNLIYQERLNDQIRRDVLLPNLLRVRTVGVDEQPNSTDTWSVKFTGRSAGGAYSEGADMADADYDSHSRKQATHSWAQYRKGAKVSGLAEALASVNAGLPVAVFDDELRDAIDDLALDIASHTYAGDVSASPVELDGLATAIDSSGTYAGLDRSTYSEWQASEQTLAASSLSVDNLRTKLHTAIYDACGLFPEIALCSSDVFDQVGALFGSERRYVDEIQDARGNMVSLKKLAGGYRGIEVDGVVYLVDRHATADTIYGMHLSAVEYVQIPARAPATQAQEVVAAVKALTGQSLDPDIVAERFRQGATRLQPYVQAIAPTGDAFKAMVKWYGQIRVRYPNRTGKLTLT